MLSIMCYLDVVINKGVKMCVFKEVLFYWEDSNNIVVWKYKYVIY